VSDDSPATTEESTAEVPTAEVSPAELHCAQCGAAARGTSGMVPLGWMTDHTGGRTSLMCDSCARRFLRAIEAKLDREWW